MKKILAVLFMLLFGAMALTACSNAEQTVEDKEALLAGHKFSIGSLNGTPFSSMQDRSQFVQFDKNLKVTGRVCNNFSGTATLKDDFLQVADLTSTKMLCSEEVNAVEGAFFAILQQGAVVTVEAETLTLSSRDSGEKVSVNDDKDSQQEGYVFVLHRENSIAE